MRFGNQFKVTKIYCPFISFQTNYLPPNAKRVIKESDVVYIKGANFFETCQIPEKKSFHVFVVFGPILGPIPDLMTTKLCLLICRQEWPDIFITREAKKSLRLKRSFESGTVNRFDDVVLFRTFTGGLKGLRR